MKPDKEIEKFEKDYREKMIKAKDDFDKMKKREGDSDLIFNKKDYKKNEACNNYSNGICFTVCPLNCFGRYTILNNKYF